MVIVTLRRRRSGRSGERCLLELLRPVRIHFGDSHIACRATADHLLQCSKTVLQSAAMDLFPFLLWALILFAILGRVMVRAYTEVNDAFVDEWARAHVLALTPRNRPMVRWYLHTARVLPTWGAVAGFFLPPLIGRAFGSPTLEDALIPLVFVGYLAGALYAELALVRPVTGGRRVAALVPREVGDYLPRRLLVAQWVSGAVALAIALAVFAVDFERDPAAGIDGSPRVMAVVFAGVAALLAVALGRLERWLVQRPQPFTEPDLVAADDAIRSQAVHSMAGSGLAIELVCLAGALLVLSRSHVQLLRWTMPVAGALGFVAAIWTCLYYGHRAWRVRRVFADPAVS